MKRLAQYDVFEIPVNDIFFDASFNCRGPFTAQSVHDLSKSISDSGLQFPVVVQPYGKEGFKYRLLAGHRRFKAVTVFLKWETIPAAVRNDLTEYESRVLNLTENLERKDLNMLEEAKAIHNLYPDGAPLRQISSELKRPTRWVHARLRLLMLPEKVQVWAAVGLLSAVNIEILVKMDSEERQIRAAKDIVTQKKKYGKTAYRKHRRNFRPRRSKAQIAELIAHLYNENCDGLATRALAWAAGYVSDIDIRADIREFVKTNNLTPRPHPEQLVVRKTTRKRKPGRPRKKRCKNST